MMHLLRMKTPSFIPRRCADHLQPQVLTKVDRKVRGPVIERLPIISDLGVNPAATSLPDSGGRKPPIRTVTKVRLAALAGSDSRPGSVAIPVR